MNGQRPKRPRISKPTTENTTIHDPLEFIQNKSTENAKKIQDYTLEIAINLYGDKHYFLRHQIGDENGKRDGIDPDIIKGIVQDAMVHLLYYSSWVPNFSFIDINGITNNRHNRVILQRIESDGVMLNVVTETHLIGPFEYETTIITAMKTNNFFMVNGQYIVELIGDGNSILKKKHNGALSKVAET
jgi:hypothetical protein